MLATIGTILLIAFTQGHILKLGTFDTMGDCKAAMESVQTNIGASMLPALPLACIDMTKGRIA